MGCCALLQGSSRPRGQTQVSCTAGGFFTIGATREAVPRVVLMWRGIPPAEAGRAAPQLLLQLGCPGALVRVSSAGATPDLIRHSRAKPNLSHTPSPLHTHAGIMAGSQQASLARQWLMNTLCSHPRQSLAGGGSPGQGSGWDEPNTEGKPDTGTARSTRGPPRASRRARPAAPRGSLCPPCCRAPHAFPGTCQK